MTNINMLHDSIENPKTPISYRSGNTTIMIHQIAGEIQIGENRTIVVCSRNRKTTYDIMQMMETIFHEQGIRVDTLSLSKQSMIVSYDGRWSTVFFRIANYGSGETWDKGLDCPIYHDITNS